MKEDFSRETTDLLNTSYSTHHSQNFSSNLTRMFKLLTVIQRHYFYMTIYLFIYLSTYLFIYLPIHLFIYLSIYLPIYLSFYPSIYSSIHPILLSIHLFILCFVSSLPLFIISCRSGKSKVSFVLTLPARNDEKG